MSNDVNYYIKLRDFVGNLEHVEQLIGDLQRVLLNIKEQAPKQKATDINLALTAMTHSLKQLSGARDRIMNKALKVYESTDEDTPRDPLKVPANSYLIRQMESAPVERFEMRRKATDPTGTMVARFPATGSWRCYTCTEGAGCSHIETVREWVHRGKPLLTDSVTIDRLASPDGYEGPYRPGDGKVVGMDYGPEK
jgi:hypothetical protein